MFILRQATVDDAQEMLGIYTPHVLEGTATFEIAPPSIEDFEARIVKINHTHLWMVAEVDGVIAAYAYASPHRDRPAYAPTCETSIYTHPDFQRKGIGRALYVALLDILPMMGYHSALGVITRPNPSSEKLHQQLGFHEIVVHPKIAFKFGQWLDTVWYRKDFSVHRDTPFSVKTFSSIKKEKSVQEILHRRIV